MTSKRVIIYIIKNTVYCVIINNMIQKKTPVFVISLNSEIAEKRRLYIKKHLDNLGFEFTF